MEENQKFCFIHVTFVLPIRHIKVNSLKKFLEFGQEVQAGNINMGVSRYTVSNETEQYHKKELVCIGKRPRAESWVTSQETGN